MNTDIIEVFLDHVSLEHTGYGSQEVSVICTINWFFPRQNVRVLSAIVPLPSVRAAFVKEFQPRSGPSLSYAERLLFKEERLGNSYFNCEFHRHDDRGAFGELLNQLFRYAVKGAGNALVGAGIDLLLNQFNIDKSSLTKIATGQVELNAETVSGLLSVPLHLDTALAALPKVDDFGDVIGEEFPLIAAGSANGELRLRFNRLA